MFKCLVVCDFRMDKICCYECDIPGCCMRCKVSDMGNCNLLREDKDNEIYKAEIPNMAFGTTYNYSGDCTDIYLVDANQADK